MNPLTAIGKGVSSPPESPVAADADLQRRFEQAIASHTANTHQLTTPRMEQPLNDPKANDKTTNLYSTDDSNEELSSFDPIHLATDNPNIHALPQTSPGIPSFSYSREENPANPNQRETLPTFAHRPIEAITEIKESLAHKQTNFLATPSIPELHLDLTSINAMSFAAPNPDITSIPVRKNTDNELAYHQNTQQRTPLHEQEDLTLMPVRHSNEIRIGERKALAEAKIHPSLTSGPKESDIPPSYPNESDGKGVFLPQAQLLPGERILATMQTTSATASLVATLIDKLSVEISITLTQQQRPTTLHLTLPNLGALEIQLTNENGKLQIEILANPITQQLLKQTRSELLERLQHLYPTQTIDLSLPSQTDSEHGSRQRRSIYEEWKDDV
ncbi:type III secretion system needle length determinant [Photorhabdus australis]|uniref:type III secretion system needle length determinant n=1 Tax=Photorhabdus australis TaxID=286156 RepID=UPI00068A69FE|nr:type III secretion system needle length determinant [Photorhabdus australis]